VQAIISHEILDFPSTTGVLRCLICPKFVFGQGSAPDSARGAHDALPHPLDGWGGRYWGGNTPRGIPPSQTPLPVCLWRLDLGASSRISFSESWQLFYRPDALSVTQPSTSKHWRQLHTRQIQVRGYHGGADRNWWPCPLWEPTPSHLHFLM